MLSLALPHVSSWNAWYVDFDNNPQRVAALLARIDDACTAAGRPPAEVEKTVALLIGFGDQHGRRTGDNPLTGTADDLAEQLEVLAQAGIGHVQAVLDPIIPRSIEQLGEVVETLRRYR
jgi:alkanesulfonate monooxygenase SsuD/methylene tetrahydromethanopterin reductase-like flavin-dependent oxidoreductase (luciferase family)